MDFNYFDFEGVNHCHIQLDKSTARGLLRFSHELSVHYIKGSDGWKFCGCDYITCGEWIEYTAEEYTDFLHDFPEFEQIEKQLK